MRRLEATWDRFDGFERSLAKGATKDQIERFVKRLGRRPPADLLRLLAWHDGSRGHDFDGYHNLLSLSGILRFKRTMDSLIPHFEETGWMPGEWWNSDWLPFLEFNGDLVCLDLVGSLVKPSGQVFSFQNYDEKRTILYRSFRDWLHTVTVIWEQAPPTASEEERLEFFVGKAAERVRRRLNRGYPVQRTARRRPVEPPPVKIQLAREAFERGPYNWRIERAGTLVRTCWGRAYSEQRDVKRFDTIDRACAFFERQVRAKVRAGYVKVPSSTFSDDDEFLLAGSRHLIALARGGRSAREHRSRKL
jgi:cell wall assembly regulator SMI1